MIEEIKISLAAPSDLCARQVKEVYSPLPYRTQFQRDRDRILYSKAFRRLNGKTQVFLSTHNDHVRTRLTHTLEVSQIARVTSKILKLDSVLAEAIALGHDVGHTPFGHVGEKTLSNIMSNCDQLANFQSFMRNSDFGFKHNLQSLRVICDLEQLYGKSSLNLTNFTLWGIKHHTKDKWGLCSFFNEAENKCMINKNPKDCTSPNGHQVGFYDKYSQKIKQLNSDNDAWSFEGQVVKQADEIAQRHHDIEDAILMKIITKDELLEQINFHFNKHFDEEDYRLFSKLEEPKCDDQIFIPIVSKFIVGFFNKKLINNSISNLNLFINQNKLSSRDDFINFYDGIPFSKIVDIVGYDNEFQEVEKSFQEFLRKRILNSFEVQRMDGKGRYIIRRLFKAYITNPKQLHDSTIYYVFRLFNTDEKELSQLSIKDIGDMRDAVDSSASKADHRFMISLLRGVCDHISGMTDNFALSEYKKLYG